MNIKDLGTKRVTSALKVGMHNIQYLFIYKIFDL